MNVIFQLMMILAVAAPRIATFDCNGIRDRGLVCNTTQLWMERSEPKWVIRDDGLAICDQAYGRDKVVIFPPEGNFTVDIYVVRNGEYVHMTRLSFNTGGRGVPNHPSTP